jgi:hypothetical protein
MWLWGELLRKAYNLPIFIGKFVQMRKLIYIIIIFTVFFFQCKEESDLPPADLGLNYFPVESGTYIIYDVDSVFYDDFTMQVDTFIFQVKEYIESDFIDNEGRTSQRIEKYYREKESDDWELIKVYFATRTENRAERVEENMRFIKLGFPVDFSNRWNGNALNTEDELEYEYTEIDVPYSINTLNFDSSLSVLHEEFVTLISEDYEAEVYARNVGLVYKKYVHVEKEITTGEIKKGYDYSYSIVEYGKE